VNSDISLALLAVLMYFPDQYARGVAQDAIVEIQAGRNPDRKLLARVVKLIEVKGATAHHADVWRAKDVIKEYLACAHTKS
jgi:hypothetical protein